MARTPVLASRVVMSRQRLVNHPGHDQKSHGRKGSGGGPGSGKDLIGSRDEAEALAQRVYDAAGQSQFGPHGDEVLYHIAREQGFDAPVTVVPKGQLEGSPIYRGIGTSRDGTKTGDQLHDEMATAELYTGRGVAGNGTYMTSRPSEAAEYGVVRGYVMQPGARVVAHDTMRAEQQEFLSGLDRDSLAYAVFSDRGRYAAARGYDAFSWSFNENDGSRTDRVVVLNRGALAMEDS